jgi:hypothetical protein
MERKAVSSSAIASIGYEKSSSTLEIEFITGTVYQYENVPENVYQGLITASSKGLYFDQHVRDAGYSYTRIR